MAPLEDVEVAVQLLDVGELDGQQAGGEQGILGDVHETSCRTGGCGAYSRHNHAPRRTTGQSGGIIGRTACVPSEPLLATVASQPQSRLARAAPEPSWDCGSPGLRR